MNIIFIRIVYLSIIFLFSTINLHADIIGSKHDLSATNFYGNYAGASTEVCVFCHAPHGGSEELDGPLWNRKVTDTSAYILYNGNQEVPNNPTLLCLSCHDGVSATGAMSAVNAQDTHNIINSPGAGHENQPATPNCYACHFSGDIYPGPEWTIGPDLTNDHPVSISYADAKSKNPSGFEPNPLNGLKLNNGNVECSSCHDPHDTTNPLFLRVSNTDSGLCNSCHIK